MAVAASAIMVVMFPAFTAASAFTVSASATASFSAQSVYHTLYLAVRCFPVLKYGAFEVERFSCKRVVQIHFHHILHIRRILPRFFCSHSAPYRFHRFRGYCRFRTASYSSTAAALEAFNDGIFPFCGMRTT
jgi:hypothetical protein